LSPRWKPHSRCAAILDVCHRLELATPARLQTGRALLLRIVSMLVQMPRSMIHRLARFVPHAS